MEFNANVEHKLGTEHVIDISDRLYKVAIGLVAVLVVVAIGWGFYAFGSLPQNAPHEINVSGEGKAYAKPDIALISFGAHTEAPKSQDAVSKNNAIMNAVIAAVKALGVDEKDIQTTQYYLAPVYDYNVRPMTPSVGAPESIAYPYPGGGKQVLRGYALDQQIQVKIRNFDNVNAILDAAAKNGANNIGSLQFTVDDMEKFRAEAREAAINQAKEKATSMFKQAGLHGQKLVNISEGYGYAPMYGIGGAALEKTDSTVAPSPSVQAGQMEINTTVTLTYRVR